MTSPRPGTPADSRALPLSPVPFIGLGHSTAVTVCGPITIVEGPTGTSLLERHDEIAALEALVDAVRDRRGGVAVVHGPAGIGKTTLTRQSVVTARERGVGVLAAAGIERQADVAYGVMRRLLGSRLRGMDAAERDTRLRGPARLAAAVLGLGEPPGPDAEPGAIAGSFAWLLADLAETVPMVLVVDDLQWVDRDSRRAIAAAAADAAQLPLGLVIAMRPDGGLEAEIDGVLRETTTTVLRPAPLTAAAATSLARGIFATEPDAVFVDACVEATGGVPLLLRECLSELCATGLAPNAAAVAQVRALAPEAVRRMVLLRLSRLTPSSASVARAVAVLGDAVEVRHAAAVAGLPVTEASAAADELARAHVLSSERPLSYPHPVLRTAVAQTMSASERSRAHARAAEVLHADAAHPEAVAAHLLPTEPAGDRTTVELLREAAAGALALGAAGAAARYLRRALEEPPPAGERWDTAHRLGVAALLAGENDAGAHLVWAADAAPPGRPRALTAFDAGRALAMENRHIEAVQWIDRAIDEIASADPDLALRFQAQYLWIAWQSEELGRAYQDRLVTLPSDLPGSTVAQQLVLCFQAHAACVARRPHTEVAALAGRALAGNRVVDLGLEGGAPASFAIALLGACDHFDEALAALAAATAASRRLGAAIAVPMFACQAAYLYLRAGLLAAAEDALALAREGLAGQPAEHLGHDYARAVRVALLLERGGAAAALAAAPRGPIPLMSTFSSELLIARGRAHMAAGDLEAAKEDLETVEQDAERRGHREVADEVVFSPDLAVLRHRMSDSVAAQRTAERFLSDARRFGAPGLLGEALRVNALVGPSQDRIPGLEEAVAVLECSPRRLARARALVDLGAALRRAGRRVDARERLRQGLDAAQRCGAIELAAFAADELRTSGGRLRRESLSGVDSLTPSERRIAELAAAGRTNRQIAQELYLTVKTVEMHLASSFRKLDVRSRGDLPRALAS